MDEHVRFSGTKYAKGNNTYNGNHYKCGENCSKIKIRGRVPSYYYSFRPLLTIIVLAGLAYKIWCAHMEALHGLGDWLPLPGRPAAQQPERQRLSTASLGREISDIPRRGVVRRGEAGEPGAGDEDLVNIARVQEGRLVRLTQGYALSIEEHGRRGIVNTHERFIGLIGRVVKVDHQSASCDGTSPSLALAPCRHALHPCAGDSESQTIPS